MPNSYKKTKTTYGFITTMPLPSQEELKNFYAETYYQIPTNSTYQESYDHLELDYKNLKCNALIYAINEKAYISKKNFLDIGAGEGFMLNAAVNNGLDGIGLDFSAYGVKKFFPHLVSRYKTGDVFDSLSELIGKGNRFSICTATNVLEHVLDPSLFLQYIRNVLEPGGLAAITVPNDYSDIQKLALQEGKVNREFWFVPPHHLHYFNTDNLINFIEDQEFEIVDAFSDFPVDLYLLHSGSNYIMNPETGREANRARMQHDIMIFKKYGLNKYLDYYRAMFRVGIGRDITVIVRSVENRPK